MSIGFIGLGSIGFPIYAHLVARYPVGFFARKPEVVAKAKLLGGTSFPSIPALAESHDVFFLFVNTFDQCRECIDQILSGCREGSSIAIGATIAPKEVRLLHETCAKRNVSLIDAPVTGGVKGAEEGVLTTMISGDVDTKRLFSPLFASYCKKIVDVGGNVGSAEVLKALVQLLVGINSVAMAEAFTLGVKSGIDAELIYDTISNSAGTSRIFENRGQKVIDRDFNKRGTIDIINKDMTICSQLAFDQKAPMFLGAVAKQMFQIAASQNDPLEDFNAVVKVYEQLSGITIKKD